MSAPPLLLLDERTMSLPLSVGFFPPANLLITVAFREFPSYLSMQYSRVVRLL